MRYHRAQIKQYVLEAREAPGFHLFGNGDTGFTTVYQGDSLRQPRAQLHERAPRMQVTRSSTS